MNHLVFLDTQAGELEKILSGVKTMLVKEFDPARSTGQPVRPGDSLFFLRSTDQCAVRVKATVVHVLPFISDPGENISHVLKEMQPRLQLIENQYNYWSGKTQVLFVEFTSARKIPVIHAAVDKIKGRSGWITFEDINLIT